MNKLSVRLGNSDAIDSINGEVIISTSLKRASQILQQNSRNPLDELDIWLDSNDLQLSGCNVWSNPMDLASFPVHKASTVTVRVVSTDNSTSDIASKNEYFQVIHSSFLLAGLTCISEQKIDSEDGSWTRIFTAKKVATTSQSTSAKAISIPKKAQSTKVMISIYDDDNGLIDEDDLLQLEEGDLAPPTIDTKENTNKSVNDCGGRKACDDCTCGRREAEEEHQISKAPIKTSACGKCGLGDAFRCASCPYLGKPAFKPGEEHLVLDLQDDF